jgi:hypothetical protein
MDETSLADRVKILEQRVQATSTLPDRMTSVELQIVQLRDEMRLGFSAIPGEIGILAETLRTEMGSSVEALRGGMGTLAETLRGEIASSAETLRGEMGSLAETLRGEIREGDAETRRYMRILHEEVIQRIATLQEGRKRS